MVSDQICVPVDSVKIDVSVGGVAVEIDDRVPGQANSGYFRVLRLKQAAG
jgi:hypothetical protein